MGEVVNTLKSIKSAVDIVVGVGLPGPLSNKDVMVKKIALGMIINAGNQVLTKTGSPVTVEQIATMNLEDLLPESTLNVLKSEGTAAVQQAKSLFVRTGKAYRNMTAQFKTVGPKAGANVGVLVAACVWTQINPGNAVNAVLSLKQTIDDLLMSVSEFLDCLIQIAESGAVAESSLSVLMTPLYPILGMTNSLKKDADNKSKGVHQPPDPIQVINQSDVSLSSMDHSDWSGGQKYTKSIYLTVEKFSISGGKIDISVKATKGSASESITSRLYLEILVESGTCFRLYRYNKLSKDGQLTSYIGMATKNPLSERVQIESWDDTRTEPCTSLTMKTYSISNGTTTESESFFYQPAEIISGLNVPESIGQIKLSGTYNTSLLTSILSSDPISKVIGADSNGNDIVKNYISVYFLLSDGSGNDGKPNKPFYINRALKEYTYSYEISS